MNTELEFHEELRRAIEYKKEKLETSVFPKLKVLFENFRSSFSSLLTLLLNKALVKEDPYKHDQKISEISIPPVTPIKENEKAAQLGSRLSFYDTQLEYITYYYVFSFDYLTEKRISLLEKFIKHIQWAFIAETSKNPTIRSLASLLFKIRNGNDPLSISIVNTCINQMASSQNLIEKMLEEIKSFKKESYKFKVRDKILINSGIYKYASEKGIKEALPVIKKKFNETMVEDKFIPEYISEIFEEEFSTESEELRKDLIYNLTQNKEKKEKTEDKKIKPPSLNMLLNAAVIVCSASGQLQAIAEKINWNVSMISEANTTVLMKILSRIFKVSTSKNIVFEIEYVDDLSGIRKLEKLEKDDFFKEIQKIRSELSREKLKIDLGSLKTPEERENFLADFIDNKNTKLKILTYQAGGIDKFIKKSAGSQALLSQLKGFIIENNAVKNIIIKSKQQAQEYKNLKEEYRQFKNLGMGE